MLPPLSTPFDAKAVHRLRAKAVRKAAARARPDAARHAAANFMAAVPVPDGGVVALYCPLADELDPGALAIALDEAGAVLALPVVVKRAAPLVFRRWRPDAPLKQGAFRVMEPLESAETVRPDVVVTPLLAFTAYGARLGYGGGYYDRTLAELRAQGSVRAAGFAYAAQEVKRLPSDGRDQPLDWIVTERAAFEPAL